MLLELQESFPLSNAPNSLSTQALASANQPGSTAVALRPKRARQYIRKTGSSFGRTKKIMSRRLPRCPDMRGRGVRQHRAGGIIMLGVLDRLQGVKESALVVAIRADQ